MAIAAVAAGALAYGIYAGEEQKSEQKKAVRRQEAAQKQAQTNAIAAERRAAEAQKAANRRTPDVGEILAFEQMQGFGAAGGGSAPPDPSKLRLGKTSALGAP